MKTRFALGLLKEGQGIQPSHLNELWTAGEMIAERTSNPVRLRRTKNGDVPSSEQFNALAEVIYAAAPRCKVTPQSRRVYAYGDKITKEVIDALLADLELLLRAVGQ